MDGALTSLRIRDVAYKLSPGHMFTLTRVLANGIAPSLEKFYFHERGFNEDDVSSLADMVEARARIPECKGLKHIDGNGEVWFDKASLATRVRLLRALLPFAAYLSIFTGRLDFEACFCEVQAPHLTTFHINFDKKRMGGLSSLGVCCRRHRRLKRS